MHGWDPGRHPVIVGDEGAVTLVEVGATWRIASSPASATRSSRPSTWHR